MRTLVVAIRILKDLRFVQNTPKIATFRGRIATAKSGLAMTYLRGNPVRVNFRLSQQLAEQRRGMACLARFAQARPCPCSAQFIALGRSQSLLLE